MQRDLSVFSVTPAASLLSRCVSRGALSQEEIDFSARQSPAFSSHLQEAEQRIRTQRQLDESLLLLLLQLQLEAELLQVERESAHVTHVRSLARRFQMLQMFCDHLQQLLKEQNRLRQRLMTPLGRTNLPVQAHLHRSVVEVVNVLLDFIDTLEEKLDSVHSCTTTRDRITQLNTSLARLLTQAAELQTLSNQVLQLKEVGRDL
ncbi:putative HAUS augmin-like complex subunit 2 isoform 4 [Scophthalmus maximus]|uniref:Putative HAUS augmin-like complex subunit 2 isoform 4 n=1 Tax=Scophthalmus maximus TaxID=52904 RepID=A0A2U9CI77_SCOMX|nr:HAUS augmin-like complex subunit 2 isoform X2 [Scophthalmus maximus]AWP15933.1 putative HAUS augmin-like complex subunit 2 isoform 4 [Scophthalmus maximus]